MKKVPVVVAAMLCLAALAPEQSGAAGYGIYEQGAAVLGRAGAGTASVDDASALFFNPANLTRLDGTRLYGGVSMLTPVSSFAGVDPYPGFGVTEEMTRQVFWPSNVYVTHAFSKDWAVGVGAFAPFGLGIEWKDPAQFTGREIVTRVGLQTVNANASIAHAFGAQWSVAAGFDLLFSHVELDRRVLEFKPGGGGGKVDVAEADLSSGYSPGPGWNVAVSFTPSDEWRFGATYRSKIVTPVDGDANLTQLPTGDPAFDIAVAAQLPPDQGVSTTLRFPAMWSFGAAWWPQPEWTVEADLNITEWSAFEDLPLYFDQSPSFDQTSIENYHDSIRISAGAEHRLPGWAYRFGYYFDQAAAPPESVTPILPDSHRHGLSVGAGLGSGPVTLDVYELAIFVMKRSTNGVSRENYNGEYKTFVNAFGVSLAYRW